MSIGRRTLLAGALALAAAPALAEAARLKLVLLGTRGGARVTAQRSNAANLLLAGDEPIVVDCGYGVTRQLVSFGLAPARVGTIFITHNHSDHMLELGPLIYNIWSDGRTSPIDVWGPPPVAQILADWFRSMAYEIDIRVADEGSPDPRKLVRVHEVAGAGPVTSVHGLAVTAAKVRHPPLDPALAYRFEGLGRSIVLSGDTAYSPELIALAKGADVLAHEVMYLPAIDALIARNPSAATLRQHLMASHTSAEDVGRVAAAAGVKTLVLTHFVPGDDPAITDAMWRAAAAQAFKGEIVVGHDLMVV